MFAFNRLVVFASFTYRRIQLGIRNLSREDTSTAVEGKGRMQVRARILLMWDDRVEYAAETGSQLDTSSIRKTEEPFLYYRCGQ
jgi:hypothetical protein